MPVIMLFGAVAAADRPVGPGVSDPLVVSSVAGGRVWDGMSVASSCDDDAEDSLADSGLVGPLVAVESSVLARLATGRYQLPSLTFETAPSLRLVFLSPPPYRIEH